MKISDLIAEYRSKNKLSMREFGILVGVSEGVVSRWESGERAPKAVNLVRLKQILSIGEENLAPLLERPQSTLTPITPTAQNTMEVPLVNQYAYAGYLDSYQNTNYMTELPKIPFFVDHFGKGHYMAFEVRGDSMDNGSSESILNGDILLCRELGRQHWQSRLHITKYDFVIVHKTDGIIIKRITAHNVDTGDVTIHSLNDAYPDYQINLDDVNQLFNVLKIERKR